MSKRVLPFFGGCAFSYLLILNHTYETEKVKKQLRTEIETLRRMKDFEIDQVAQFREHGSSARDEDCNIDNMDTHYVYFWTCLGNSMREALFTASSGSTIQRLQNQVIALVPE